METWDRGFKWISDTCSGYAGNPVSPMLAKTLKGYNIWGYVNINGEEELELTNRKIYGEQQEKKQIGKIISKNKIRKLWF